MMMPDIVFETACEPLVDARGGGAAGFYEADRPASDLGGAPTSLAVRWNPK